MLPFLDHPEEGTRPAHLNEPSKPVLAPLTPESRTRRRSSTWEGADLVAQAPLHSDGSGFGKCIGACTCSLRCCSWTSSNPHSQSGFSLKRLATAYILYVAFGSAIFKLSSVPEWDWAQAVYYAMTTGLSIGYGAMQPSSTLCKIFAIAYIIFGACALTLLLSVFVRKLLNLVPLIAAEEWKYQAEAKLRAPILGLRSRLASKYRVEIVLWIALICWMALGTIWARKWQGQPNDKPQWTWLTSAFFAVGTVTTAGMLGPEVDDNGKVPTDSAVFLAIYTIIGVPIFGAALSHRASTYVEAQVRRQERDNLDNRLHLDVVNAVRELRHGVVAARRSSRTPESQKWTNPSTPDCHDFKDGRTTHLSHLVQSPDLSLMGDRNPNDDRVLWGDFLALQLLRLRKVDFDLLKDLREQYLETIARGHHGAGLQWSMLTTPDGEDFLRSSCQFLSSEMEAQPQAPL